MSTPTTLRTTLLRVAIVLAAVPMLAGAAVRHLALKSSAPTKDETLTSAPDAVRLWFTEKPELPTTRVRLIRAPHDTFTLGKLTRDATAGAPIVAPISGTVGTGAYTVEWSTMSRDGHVVKGSYRFTVAP